MTSTQPRGSKPPVGQPVMAKYPDWPCYYPGKVSAVKVFDVSYACCVELDAPLPDVADGPHVHLCAYSQDPPREADARLWQTCYPILSAG